jgi:hypothetical protein
MEEGSKGSSPIIYSSPATRLCAAATEYFQVPERLQDAAFWSEIAGSRNLVKTTLNEMGGKNRQG